MEALLTYKDTHQLNQAWKGLEQAKPGIRIREAAKLLDVSEAQLLATTIGESCIRLNNNWTDLVPSFKKLGKVMSLTRNDACILEHKGSFQKINTFGSNGHAMGTVIGPIETRIFFKNWHVAFAVNQEKNGKGLTSLQVFDKAGDAVTKIYLQENSDKEAFEKLVEDFKSDDQSPVQETIPYPEEIYNTQPDKEAVLAEWEALKDTHDFFPMLKKHNLSRYDALDLAQGKFTYLISPEAIRNLLEQAAKTKLPIMIFAGNRGNLQIHQGKIRTIRMLERGHSGAEKWLNILDPDFNMHLRTDLVESAWVVNKPTSDGIVTAVELYDAGKNLIAQFFGLRKAGIPQREEWQNLVNSLEAL